MRHVICSSLTIIRIERDGNKDTVQNRFWNAHGREFKVCSNKKLGYCPLKVAFVYIFLYRFPVCRKLPSQCYFKGLGNLGSLGIDEEIQCVSLLTSLGSY